PGAFGRDVNVQFADGYGPDGAHDANLLAGARELAASAAVAVVAIGLPASMETEGRDRDHIDLPAAHNELIESVLAVQPNTVVVLINGSAVAMPWAEQVPAILEGWLGGQAGGSALADILTGAVNPSGKLAETFPVRIEDTPSHLSFPTSGDGTARYTEGVFSGHRWYDARRVAPRFPFGHGLSYTSFTYDGIAIDASDFAEYDALRVDVAVENTGDVAGMDVVQLYIGECSPRVQRPVRELKAFRKVDLQPGDVEIVQFMLGWRDFAFYDAAAGQWVMDSGEYEIAVGASSADIRVSAREHLESSRTAPLTVSVNTPFRVALDHPVMGPMLQPVVKGMREYAPSDEAAEMMMLFMGDMPLRKFTQMGIFTDEQLTGMVAAANAG
ncbi:MAG TPA: glycoside hydrolase family 3 C-terminal domain-containing protein, partial [Thermomicrobiales bacterium]|nr:glycoside hydrolase family 3 C-terminal domain-containing protein [Thermomicrobiales bacterium]